MTFTMTGILLILAVFITLASSNCDSMNRSVASGCQMLYKQLEAALLEPTNLYTLRHSFFPNMRTQPNLLPINYTGTLKFDRNISEPCAGAENQWEEHNETYIPIKRELFWTNSAALSIINPRLLDYLLSMLLYLYNPITTDDRYGALNYVHLQINIENFSCVPSQQQVMDGLEDLSTMLKVYANAQGLIDSWDSQYRGYITDPTTTVFSVFTIAIPVILLVIAVTMVVAKVAVLKTFHERILKKIEGKEAPYYSLFWATYIVIVISNIVFALLEVIGAIIWLHVDKNACVAVALKLSFFILGIVLAFVAAVITTKLLREFRGDLHIELPDIRKLCKDNSTVAGGMNRSKEYSTTAGGTSSSEQNLAATGGMDSSGDNSTAEGGTNHSKENSTAAGGTNHSKENSTAAGDTNRSEENSTAAGDTNCSEDNSTAGGNHQRFRVHLFIIFNFEFFAVLIIWNLVPVALLVFVHPIITVAGVSFMLSLFWLSPIIFTLVFQSLDSKRGKHETAYRILHFVINLYIIGCIVWVVVTWIVTYVKIASRGVDAGGAVMFAVAFLPTVILTVAALGGKRLLHKFDLKPQKKEQLPDVKRKDGKIYVTIYDEHNPTEDSSHNK